MKVSCCFVLYYHGSFVGPIIFSKNIQIVAKFTKVYNVDIYRSIQGTKFQQYACITNSLLQSPSQEITHKQMDCSTFQRLALYLFIHNTHKLYKPSHLMNLYVHNCIPQMTLLCVCPSILHQQAMQPNMPPKGNLFSCNVC